MTRRTVGAWCTAAVILFLSAGCASATPKPGVPASRPGSPAAQPQPVWFYSLQMTSATSGWALVWSANPAVAADNAHIVLARTGFLTVAPPPPGTPSLLDSQDQGQTWQLLTLPSGAGQYPQVKFFASADGVLVTAGPQEALGGVFYATVDGGRSWTPVPQGTHFTQYGEAIDFASQQAGFAWNSGGDTVAAPPLYATANSGRTWHLFIPHLVTG